MAPLFVLRLAMGSKKVSQMLLDALGKQKGESKNSTRALHDYAMMERRSLRELCRRYQRQKNPPTKRLATLKAWSKRYEWQSRLVQFDLIVEDERVAEWEKRKAEINELDWQHGIAIRDILIPLFKDQSDPLELNRLVNSLFKVSQLQRLATNEPTDISELRGAALAAVVEGHIERAHGSGVAIATQVLPQGTDAEEDHIA
jgi:CRISPR/Cas system CSM-associated protein Csm3 (group 7 of RAMP superfamily)